MFTPSIYLDLLKEERDNLQKLLSLSEKQREHLLSKHSNCYVWPTLTETDKYENTLSQIFN